MSDDTEVKEPVTKRQRERLHDTGEAGVQEPLPYRNTAKKSNSTVTVACNLPNGIILQGWKMVSRRESGMKDEALVAQLDESLGTFQVKGNAVAFGMPTSHLVGGFALTRGVPAALWDNWLHYNKDSYYVKNNCIFAHERLDEVKSEARDKRTIKSGLERIDPDDPGARTGIRRIKRENRPEEADLDDEF